MNTICPLCNFTEYRVIGIPKTNRISKQFININYNVVQCTNCDVYYVNPRISFSSDQWAKLYNDEYFSSQSNWLIRKRAKELSERLNKALQYLPDSDISFLDIGSGEGKTLVEGLKRGWRVTGIDIVDNRIEEAKSERIKFITGNFLDHDFPENHFDFIYLDSVLEHVLDPKDYLLKIKKILKVGGIVYIGVPNEDSLFNDIRRILFYLTGGKNISVKIKPFDSPYHVIGFNRKSITYIFNESNLEIAFLRNFGRKFDFLKHKPNQRAFWVSLFFLLPIEFIGKILNRDVYFEAYVKKN